MDASQIRQEINDFLSLAPLPAEGDASVVQMEALEQALLRITPPLTRDEAVLLVGAFGPDGCYGLALGLVSLIESAPGDPVVLDVSGDDTWVQRLRQRARNGGW
ncbi:MAG: hypothetical protein V4850_17495 [Myxococcota bacterium]